MKITKLLVVLGWLLTLPVDAQITLDGSMGTAGVLSGPDFLIGADLGQQRGGNLFHSFGEFSIQHGQSATFTGPNSVQNVISRVTGGNPSDINGLLRNAIPDADTYLVNPAGIMVGPAAELDLMGSLYLTTADILRFADGAEFSASLGDESVLSVAAVSEFGFLGGTSGEILISDNQFTLLEGKRLSLAGNGLIIDKSWIDVPSGRIDLVSLADEGGVALETAEVSGERGTIGVYDSIVSTSGEGGGEIYIHGGEFELHSTLGGLNTLVEANTEGNLEGKEIQVQVNKLTAIGSQFRSFSSNSGNAGRIEIVVNGPVLLTSNNNEALAPAGIFTLSEDTGNAGDIYLTASELILEDGAAIAASTRAEGHGGNLTILVAGNIALSGLDRLGFGSLISSNSNSTLQTSGNAGDIYIEAKGLRLDDGAVIGSSPLGGGHGGDIHIKVKGMVSLSGVDSPKEETQQQPQQSVISVSTESKEAFGGNAGSILIEANQLTLHKGTDIRSTTWGGGKGGGITIQAGKSVIIEPGAGIYATTGSFEEYAGDAGNITLKTKSLYVDGVISTITDGAGKGGNIIVRDADLVVVSGGVGAFTAGKTIRLGNGGKIEIRAEELMLQGELLSNTSGTGKGGDITLYIRNLQMNNNAYISVSSVGINDAGRIIINATDTIIGRDTSIIAFADNAGGGEIELTTGDLQLTHNAHISTSVYGGNKNSGNVTLNIGNYAVLNNSTITARADQGFGGNITLNADILIRAPNVNLDASSNITGNDGTVQINAPDIDTNSFVKLLSTAFDDLNDIVNQQCIPATSSERSTLSTAPLHEVYLPVNDLKSF